MRNLPDPTREKAIEIANALLEEGMEEGKAIRIAITKAREWVRHHFHYVRLTNAKPPTDGPQAPS